MNKTIKKVAATICAVVLSGVCILSTSCKICDYVVQGIGNHISDDWTMIYDYFLPSEMETKYPYIDGDLYYKDNLFDDVQVVCIEYLKYTEEIYPEAKEYMLTNTDYTEEVHYTYNGYEFYENLTRPREKGDLDENGMNTWGLEVCHFICYNDSNQTLVFTALYQSSDKTCEQEDWGAFLKKYFPYYDFDA
jgi:hypothetical protein